MEDCSAALQCLGSSLLSALNPLTTFVPISRSPAAIGVVYRVILCVSPFSLCFSLLSLSPEEWVRPVMKRDKQVLLHWGYYPDR